MAESVFLGGGGGTPGGADTQVQFNNAGSFGGFGAFDGTTMFMGDIGPTDAVFAAFSAEQGPPAWFAGQESITGPAVMTAGVPEFYLGRYKGTKTSPTPVQSGDLLGELRFVGFNPGDGITASIDEGVLIRVVATGNADEYFVPAKVEVRVTDAAGSLRTPIEIYPTALKVLQSYLAEVAGTMQVSADPDGASPAGFRAQYQSTDGTAGATGDVVIAGTGTLSFKNGLFVAFTPE